MLNKRQEMGKYYFKPYIFYVFFLFYFIFTSIAYNPNENDDLFFLNEKDGYGFRSKRNCWGETSQMDECLSIEAPMEGDIELVLFRGANKWTSIPSDIDVRLTEPALYTGHVGIRFRSGCQCNSEIGDNLTSSHILPYHIYSFGPISHATSILDDLFLKRAVPGKVEDHTKVFFRADGFGYGHADIGTEGSHSSGPLMVVKCIYSSISESLTLDICHNLCNDYLQSQIKGRIIGLSYSFPYPLIITELSHWIYHHTGLDVDAQSKNSVITHNIAMNRQDSCKDGFGVKFDRAGQNQKVCHNCATYPRSLGLDIPLTPPPEGNLPDISGVLNNFFSDWKSKWVSFRIGVWSDVEAKSI